MAFCHVIKVLFYAFIGKIIIYTQYRCTFILCMKKHTSKYIPKMRWVGH